VNDKLLPVITKLAGVNERLMRDDHPVQFAFQLVFPEMQEFVQDGKAGSDVEVLPNISLQQGRMVRHMINNFGSRQAIILKLLREVAVGSVHHLNNISRLC
jgi:hypothetical protein